jgi:hypothetical protein
MRNRSVSQVLFDLFRAGVKKSGWEIFRYDPTHYLIFTVDLPVTFQVDRGFPDIDFSLYVERK